MILYFSLLSQAVQSYVICYDCGTQSVWLYVSVAGMCPQPVLFWLWGVPLAHTHALLTSLQLRDRQTLLFLDCENDRDG